MSPNDICLIEELEPLFEAGIDSFKIDGILQSEEYINTVTAQYREAIDLYNEDPEAYEDEKFMLVDQLKQFNQNIVHLMKDSYTNKQFIKRRLKMKTLTEIQTKVKGSKIKSPNYWRLLVI